MCIFDKFIQHDQKLIFSERNVKKHTKPVCIETKGRGLRQRVPRPRHAFQTLSNSFIFLTYCLMPLNSYACHSTNFDSMPFYMFFRRIVPAKRNVKE